MSDKDRVIALFNDLKIPFTEKAKDNIQFILIESNGHVDGTSGVTGYCGFYARWEFDENGRFITVGIYE